MDTLKSFNISESIGTIRPDLIDQNRCYVKKERKTFVEILQETMEEGGTDTTTQTKKGGKRVYGAKQKRQKDKSTT